MKSRLRLIPDLSVIVCRINPRLGAWTLRPAQSDACNLIHHKGLEITLYVLSALLPAPWLTLTGILLFAHSRFDRILGYGLKHEDAFQNTHLGRIGR